MGNLTRCKVCQRPERRRNIDASYAEGMSAAAISRRESASGFPISPEAIIRHLREHYVAPVPEGVAKRKKDLALLVQERTVDFLESTTDDEGDPIGPGWAGWKDALGPGLAAQKIIDQREARSDNKKLLIAFGRLLTGMQEGVMLAPPERRLLPDPTVIEGEAVEVDD